VELFAAELHILGIYLPGATSDGGPLVKAAFWEALNKAASALSHKRALIIGDLNTGAHFIDETRATFYSADAFVALGERLGWRDAFRLIHGDQREYSWWNHNRSAARESKLSDHSQQILSLHG
jgi:exonuclease III